MLKVLWSSYIAVKYYKAIKNNEKNNFEIMQKKYLPKQAHK